jgi:hypothetical protein
MELVAEWCPFYGNIPEFVGMTKENYKTVVSIADLRVKEWT